MRNSIECVRWIKENPTNFQWRVSIKSTENVMCNVNRLRKTRRTSNEELASKALKMLCVMSIDQGKHHQLPMKG